MTNQAAQTIPELPEPAMRELNPYHGSRIDPYAGATHLQWYTADQMHQYARDYAAALSQTAGVVLARGWFHALPDEDDYEFHDDASGAGKNCDGCIRAVIVAAPAASGGEDYSACCDTPAYCSSVRRCTAKDSRQPPSAASVSERLLALADEIDRQARECPTVDWRPNAHENARNLRALEQALTQQRGGSSVRIEDLGQNAPLRHEERADAEHAYTLTAFDYENAQIGSRDWTIYWRGWWHRSQLYTTPQPSADAVREEGNG